MHCLWSGTMLMIMRMMYEEEEVAVLVSTLSRLCVRRLGHVDAGLL